MLIRTHLLITLFFVLLFFSNIENRFLFAIVALIATFIPDIDSKFSTLGKKKTFRILQLFIKHRGMLHSFSFLLAITFLLNLFVPFAVLPFFLGYGLHLFADSFTKKGIRPFYPFKKRFSWKIKTSGRSETVVFVIFLIADLSLLFWKIFEIA